MSATTEFCDCGAEAATCWPVTRCLSCEVADAQALAAEYDHHENERLAALTAERGN